MVFTIIYSTVNVLHSVALIINIGLFLLFISISTLRHTSSRLFTN